MKKHQERSPEAVFLENNHVISPAGTSDRILERTYAIISAILDSYDMGGCPLKPMLQEPCCGR